MTLQCQHEFEVEQLLSHWPTCKKTAGPEAGLDDNYQKLTPVPNFFQPGALMLNILYPLHTVAPAV